MQKSRCLIGACLTVLVVAVLASTAAVGADSSAPPPGGGAGTVPAAVVVAPEKKAVEPQKPVQISADAAEYFNKDGLVVFSGSVIAVQGDATLSADRIEVSFVQSAAAGEKPQEKPEPEPKPKSSIGAPSNAQRISTMVALGNVKFRQLDPESKKERYATGDKGVYDVEKRLVTMSGNPRLWEGKNVIVGDEMVFHIDDKKVVVKGKVNLTVFPDDLKEQKKP